MRVAAHPGARLVVLGASGYTGQELARLVLAHPGLEVVALGSREHAGAPAESVLVGCDAHARTLPPLRDPAELVSWFERGAADALVSCLPHGAWRTLAAEHPALAALPAWIVDLSADRRDGAGGWAYGLPEAFRDGLAGAPRIANPGCYPTALALALLPAVAAGLLAGPVSVAALSGVSGAGRGASARTSFVELEGGASIYRAGSEHPHAAEMERSLARLGAPVPVGFVPQLVPMARGILLTASVALARPHDPDEMRALYCERYAPEAFVRVLPEGCWPETRAVRHSNRCDVAITTLHGGRTLLATAAIDNLVKGAAGQAIQNLNLMLGWPETTGLPAHGLPW
jgi:N-acetyl-gamma-glutamyl-phosphate reductase